MEDFYDAILKNRITLVDFYATWCGPCRAMHPILENLKTLTGDKLRILKLDIDDPDNALIIGKYNIRSVPTLIFFRSGAMLWRGSGVVSAEHLAGLVEKFHAESVNA